MMMMKIESPIKHTHTCTAYTIAMSFVFDSHFRYCVCLFVSWYFATAYAATATAVVAAAAAAAAGILFHFPLCARTTMFSTCIFSKPISIRISRFCIVSFLARNQFNSLLQLDQHLTNRLLNFK